MAEFTEFMNQRVEHFFSMFKELRSGSISYPEIAKRENVRPPINKVCQKLGVKKVIQMTDDDKLYKAITSVVYDIEMKRKTRLEENNKTENLSNISKISPTAPPGLTRSSSSVTAPLTPTNASILTPSCSSSSVEFKTENKILSHVIQNENHEFSSASTATTPIPITSTTTNNNNNDLNKNTNKLKSIERLSRVPPALLCSAKDLYTIILAVRSNNGRFQKAISIMKTLSNETSSKDNIPLTTTYIQNVVKTICMLIGCSRLDMTVSLEDLDGGFNRYVQQSQENTSCCSSTITTSSIVASTVNSITTSTSITTGLNTVVNSTNISVPPSTEASNVVYEEQPLSITISPLKPNQGGEEQLQNPVGPAENSVQNPLLSVEDISIEAKKLYTSMDGTTSGGTINTTTTTSSATTTSNTTLGLNSTSTVSPAVVEPLSLPAVYTQFWELAHKLFLYVCNPYRHCKECLCVVEDIVQLLAAHTQDLLSPLTALALDSVIQRAMYELSDKVSRPLPTAIQTDLQQSIPNMNHLQSETELENTVHNIELCITLMSREVTPICMRIRDEFLGKHGLLPNYNSNTSGSNNYNSNASISTTSAMTAVTTTTTSGGWCEKVITLTRQLSELISWSSSHSQARVPAFIPPGKFSPVRTQLKDQYFTDVCSTTSATTTSNTNNQNTTTMHNIHTSEPHVMQYINKLSPNSYKEIIHKLCSKDQVLANVILELSSAHLCNNTATTEYMNNLYNNMNTIIKKYINQNVEFYSCGSNMLHIYDMIGKMKVDYIALLPPYHKNIYDYNQNDQKVLIKSQQYNTHLVHNLERIVEYSKLTEIAWKHLKACVRDFHTLASEYIIKLTATSSSGSSNNSNSGNSRGTYHNNNTTTTSSSAIHSNQLVPPPEIILQIADDSECIYKIGNNIIEKYYNQRIQYMQKNTTITLIQNKIIELNNNNEKEEKEKNNFIRKICKNLERVLKDQRYLYVRTITNKTRFIHLNFDAYMNNNTSINCNIYPCTTLPLHMTRLINNYIHLDSTNKIQDYFQTIKLFVSAHNICDPAGGYLSTTAWYCMALHVLLYYNILPNIHRHTLYIGCDIPTNTTSSTSSNTTSTTIHSDCINENNTKNTTSSTHDANISDALSDEYIENLSEIPLLVLLDLFFRYYVEVVNVFTNIITLRDGENMLLPKVCWPINAVLWRISIEDPLEPIGSAKPYDLGCTLSRPGQLTTYKALRRAVYGIHSIMAENSSTSTSSTTSTSNSDTQDCIRKLFSRVELINLARKSDYMGAVITASPAWVRPSIDSVLDRVEYIDYMENIEKHFESDEGKELLEIVRTVGEDSTVAVENRDGSSNADRVYKANNGGYTHTQAGVVLNHLSAKATAFQPNNQGGRGGSNRPASGHPSMGPSVGALTPPSDLRSGPFPPPYQQQPHQGYKLPTMGAPVAATSFHPHTGAYPVVTPYTTAPSPYAVGPPPPEPLRQMSPHPPPSVGYPVAGIQQHLQGTYAANRDYMYQYAGGQNDGAQYIPPVSQQPLSQRSVYAPTAPPTYQQLHTPYQNVPLPQQQQQSQQQYQAQGNAPRGYPYPRTAYPAGDACSSWSGQETTYPQQYPPQRPPHTHYAPQQQFHQQYQPQVSPQGVHQYQYHQQPQPPLQQPPPYHQQQQAQNQSGRPRRTQEQYPHFVSGVPTQSRPAPPVNQLTGRKTMEATLSMSSSSRSSQSDFRSASALSSARTNDLTPRVSDESYHTASLSARYTPTSSLQELNRTALSDDHNHMRYHTEDDGSARSGYNTARSQSAVEHAMYTPQQQQQSLQQGGLSARLNNSYDTARSSSGRDPSVDTLYTTAPPSARSGLDMQHSPRYTDEANYPSTAAMYSARSSESSTVGTVFEEDMLPSNQVQQLHPASYATADILRPVENQSSATSRLPMSLQQGLKLDLQPQYAEDRYALSENDPIVDFTTSQMSSARSQESNTITPIQPLSARGGDIPLRRRSLPTPSASDLCILTSPRDNMFSTTTNTTVVENSNKPHKSPLVPLIPLEGLSNYSTGGYSSSSASSSDYGYALTSDRSSVFYTNRSEILPETDRSTIVPAGTTTGSLLGGLASSRTNGTISTQHQSQLGGVFGQTGISVPGTSRSILDMSLGSSIQNNIDDCGKSNYINGLCLSSRVHNDDSYTGHMLTEQNLAEAQPTNRLGYMGFDDQHLTHRVSAVVPLPTIRSTAASSSNYSGRSNSEFDELLERISADPVHQTQRRGSQGSNSSAGGGNNSNSGLNASSLYNTPLGDYSLHSARGSSGRTSAASLTPMEGLVEFTHSPRLSSLQPTPRQLTPRREVSLMDSIAESVEISTTTHIPAHHISSADLLPEHNNNSNMLHKLQPTDIYDTTTNINTTTSATETGTKPSYLHSLFNTSNAMDTLE